jgi:glycine cleavage system H protein
MAGALRGRGRKALKWSGPVAADVSKTPQELLYSKSHEWVRIQGGEATIGITDHAQEALNDIVYVELPKVGARFELEAEFGVVESVKSVSDLYMPVAGEVTAVNTTLDDKPETLNEDPYGAGWLIKVKLKDPAQAKALLSAAQYEKEIGH